MTNPCKFLSGGQGYFHREDAKKSDFKNFALFASSRWIFWVAAGLHCVHLWFRSFFWLRLCCSVCFVVSLFGVRVWRSIVRSHLGSACALRRLESCLRKSCGPIWLFDPRF